MRDDPLLSVPPHRPVSDYLTDRDITTPVKFVRPDYVGVVSGAQYKLENAEGVTECALVVIGDGVVTLIEMSPEDLLCLRKQLYRGI